jgi:hypothetical protein
VEGPYLNVPGSDEPGVIAIIVLTALPRVFAAALSRFPLLQLMASIDLQ